MENNCKLRIYKFHYDENTGNRSPNCSWMMTFADLLVLMLVFFVLIYSMSSIKNGDWDEVTKALGGTFNANKIIDQSKSSTSLAISKKKEKPALDLYYLYSIMENNINSKPVLSEKVKLEYHNKNITITLKTYDLFSNLNTNTNNNGTVILSELGNILQQISNSIEIVSYSNSDSEVSKKQGSNSLKRAINVAKAIKEYGEFNQINAIVKFYQSSKSEETKNNAEIINIVISPYINDL